MAKFILHRKNTRNYHNVQITTAIISFRAGSLSAASPLPTLHLKTLEKGSGAEERRREERRMGRQWWWWWFWEEEVVWWWGVHVNTTDNFAEESYSNGACWSTSNESPPMTG